MTKEIEKAIQGKQYYSHHNANKEFEGIKENENGKE